ncbi:hypothetical protein EST38_g9490 [Candolleomyces aberdarensis]|uniref:MYND-type domain-containing protein n=1 Tax=Candolleomyces aberdarensis TaxID=2316362 RepID=A0A4Q2D9S2_9AGAR|nr:hypothetical protein EST38_g9490 [Candolleomyces aberdarensis]
MVKQDHPTFRPIGNVIKFFHETPVPAMDPSHPPDGELLQRAMGCTIALFHAIDKLKKRPSWRELAVAKIIPAVEQLCLWMGFLLRVDLDDVSETKFINHQTRRAKDAYLKNSAVIRGFVDLDGRLQEAFISAPAFVEFVARLWAGQNNEHFLFLNEEHGCPIMYLMLTVLGNDDCRTSLFHHVTASPPWFYTRFIDGTLERSRLASDSFIKINPIKTLIYIAELQDATELLILDPGLRRRLHKEEYLTNFAEALMFTSMEKRIWDRTSLRKFLQLLLALAGHCERDSRTIFNWRDLVYGSFFVTTVRVLAAIPPKDNQSIKIGDQLLKLIGQYCVFPSVLSKIGYIEIPKDLVMNSALASDWSTLSRATEKGLEIYKDQYQNGISLCDNLTCSHSVDSSSSFKSKACSGCSSVAYCSRQCQKEDWAKRHRLECQYSRIEHALRRLDETLYRLPSRGFHVALIESIFNENKLEIEKLRGQDPKPNVTVIDFTRDGGRNFPTEDLEIWYSEAIGLTPQYLEPRFSSLVQEHRTDPQAFPLVNAVFPFGTKEMLVLTVKLRAVEGSKFKGVYSVMRYL